MNGLGATVMLAWGDSGVVLLELILLACSFHSVMFLPFVDLLRIINSCIDVFRKALLPFICDDDCFQRDGPR